MRALEVNASRPDLESSAPEVNPGAPDLELSGLEVSPGALDSNSGPLEVSQGALKSISSALDRVSRALKRAIHSHGTGSAGSAGSFLFSGASGAPVRAPIEPDQHGD